MTSKDAVYKTVNYPKVYCAANEILALNNVIKEFPFKVKDLVYEQSDIRLCSYAKAFSKYGIKVNELGSESAVWINYIGANIIFFNQDEPSYRVRFDVMHEFGHYKLKHISNLSYNNPMYQKQELEANCFAAQILMPEQIIRECNKRGKNNSIQFLKTSFGVSEEAAKKRQHTLAKSNPEWRNRAESYYDDIILTRYRDIIEKLVPKVKCPSNYFFEDDFERQRERDNWF